MFLICKDNIILKTDTEGGISGTLIINGVVYENICAVSYDGEIPEDLKPEQYLLIDGQIIENPDYMSNDVNTRLNDIEQILIDLLDTI